MNKQEFWLRLLMVKGARLKNIRKLNVRKVLTSYQVDQLLIYAELNDEQKQMFYQPNERYLNNAIDWLNRSGNHLVTYHDVDYPELLRHIKDSPPALFVAGNVAHLNSTQLAMVGSRHFSHYGKQWGSYFAAELVNYGFTITSGLALGIDSICHQAAISNKGITIAVLGSGLEQITPRQHHVLATRILESDGVLVSEFLPSAKAMPEHFPRRNRIVSGLSKGVLIVEAALKSGSLITAKCALEQGREVFALPGPLGNPGYQGTHWLIQQGANLVTQPADINEYLNSTLNWLDEVELQPDNRHDEADDILISPLLAHIGDEATPIDIIADRMSLSIADISLQLVELELAGYIASVTGGYIRVRHMNCQ